MGLQLTRWTAGFSVLVLLAPACSGIVGRVVVVEFRQAPDLQGGESVLLDQQQIGTAGRPTVADGSIRVPVRLDSKHRDVLPGSAVFVVRDDPTRPGRGYLVAFALSESRDADKSPRYRGVASEVELALIVGADNARGMWERLVR